MFQKLFFIISCNMFSLLKGNINTRSRGLPGYRGDLVDIVEEFE